MYWEQLSCIETKEFPVFTPALISQHKNKDSAARICIKNEVHKLKKFRQVQYGNKKNKKHHIATKRNSNQYQVFSKSLQRRYLDSI